MDYRIYDKIQMELGAVGDSFKKECQTILETSPAESETKKLVSKICAETENYFNELAILISQSLVMLSNR